MSEATNAIVATIPVGSSPWAVTYDSGKGEVFVADRFSANIKVISDAMDEVVATIPDGFQPWDAVYDSGKGEVFVTNTDDVSVISDATNTVVGRFPVGGCAARRGVRQREGGGLRHKLRLGRERDLGCDELGGRDHPSGKLPLGSGVRQRDGGDLRRE